jgi:hypothetical protein
VHNRNIEKHYQLKPSQDLCSSKTNTNRKKTMNTFTLTQDQLNSIVATAIQAATINNQEATKPVCTEVPEAISAIDYPLAQTITPSNHAQQALESYATVGLTCEELHLTQAVDCEIDDEIKAFFEARKCWLRNVTTGDYIATSRTIRNSLHNPGGTTGEDLCKRYEVDQASDVYIGKRAGRNCYSTDALVKHAMVRAVIKRLQKTRAAKFAKGEWVVLDNEASVEQFIKRIHENAGLFSTSAQCNAAKRLFITIVRGEADHAAGYAKFFDVELGVIHSPFKLIKWLAISV